MSRRLRCNLLFVLICGVCCSHSAYAGQFLEASSYTGGAGTVAIAIGDLNGDGKVDVVLGNSSDHTVGVILGNGDGTFQAPMNFGGGTDVDYVAVGDFNKDGHLDVAALNRPGNKVNILLGNGDGTLQSGVTYATGNTPRSLTVADVNNDGNLDLITANGLVGGAVSILLGNGDGTFMPHSDIHVPGNELLLSVVGDFNNDGKPDILSADGAFQQVILMLGNGDGTFQGEQSVAPVYGTSGLVAADFNGDGKLDFASSGLEATLEVFLGNGDGTFQPGISYPLLVPTMLATGDVNGDGIIDLVGGISGAAVLLGNGDGTFQFPNYYGSVNGDSYVALADVNGDGKIDFLGTQNNPFLGQLDVLIGIGGGQLFTHRDYYAGGASTFAAAGDFNGDGKVDLAVVNDPVCCSVVYLVGLLLGNGDGTFPGNPKALPLGTKSLRGIAAGDLNGDGKLDLVVAVFDGIDVLLGNGDGTFQNQVGYGHAVSAFNLLLADFNKDGHLDVAVADYTAFANISVYLGNGDGTFQPQTDYSAGKNAYQLATGDFNGDGNLDIAFTSENTDSLGVLFGNGDGTFQPQVQINTGTGSAPRVIATGDLNHDGKLDLAFSTRCSSKCSVQASVMLGNGDGTFGPATNYPLPSGLVVEGIAIADMNSDGKPDLVTTVLSNNNQTSVLLGNGDGTFKPRSDYAGGGLSLVVADFNRDNALDIASPQGVSQAIPDAGLTAVLLNTSGTTIRRSSSPNPSKQGQAIVFTATVIASLPGQPTPSGKVTWKDGSTTLGSGTLQQGKAQFTTSSLSVGQHTITVSYSGDSHFQAHTAASLIQVVNP